MPSEALPCIVCERRLESVDETAENQPYGGTAFLTHGHYGSTAFDPMDGHFLEINICDDCLKKAGARNAVYTSRDAVLVKAPDVKFGSSIVGMKPVSRPYVYWREDMPGYGDDDYYQLTFDDDEVMPSDIHLNIPYDQLKASFLVEEIEAHIKADPHYVLSDEEADIVRFFLQIPGRWDRMKFANQYPQFRAILRGVVR